MLSGTSVNTLSPIISEENKTPVVKDDKQSTQQETIPLTVKSPMQNDSVKYSTNNETLKTTKEESRKEENIYIKPTSENTPDNNTLKIQLARFMQAIEDKFNRAIAELKKELSVKHEELIVKYDNLIIKQEQSVKDNQQIEIAEQAFTLTEKANPTLNCKPIAFNKAVTVAPKTVLHYCNTCESLIVKYFSDTAKNTNHSERYFTINENQPEQHIETEVNADTVLKVIPQLQTNENNLRVENNQPEQPEIKETETTPSHETHQPIDSRKPTTHTEENETVQEEENKAPENKEENQIQKTSTTNPEIKHPDKIEQTIAEEPPYKWIQAKLMRLIEYKYRDDDSVSMLKEPSKYWSYEKVKQVTWVNVRLCCLIESIIKLSNYSRIDTHTLFCIADAFNRLLHSHAFKNSPANYPYKLLIPDLCNKITQMAEQNRNETELTFHLPLERKAQLLAIRYQMQNYVPAIKFSEIDFTEGNTQTYKPKYAA